jgi:general secretion pathway protein F
MRQAVQDAAVRVREGAPIACRSARAVVPPMLVHLIASGRPAASWRRCWSGQPPTRNANSTGWSTPRSGSGPVMIPLMGVFVFLIAVALLLPIFQLNQLVR